MDRISIKARAKQVFSADYWRLVGLTVIVTAMVAVVMGLGTDLSIPYFGDFFRHGPAAWLKSLKQAGTFRISINSSSILRFAVCVFAIDFFALGHAKICLAAYRGESYGSKDLIFAYSENRFWKTAGAMALRRVFISLGCLVFVIPGIIVALGLSQVPYLLIRSDDGTGIKLSPMVAIRASWKMMQGHKWELFVFWLSFLGWHILNAITCGILGVFYVTPYFKIALAGYHDALCRQAGVDM